MAKATAREQELVAAKLGGVDVEHVKRTMHQLGNGMSSHHLFPIVAEPLERLNEQVPLPILVAEVRTLVAERQAECEAINALGPYVVVSPEAAKQIIKAAEERADDPPVPRR